VHDVSYSVRNNQASHPDSAKNTADIAVACGVAPFHSERGARHGTLDLMGRHAQICALVAIALLTVESRPQAYIDPGSTGLFLQGLIGGIAAFIVLTRSWWQRILSRIRRSPPHDASTDKAED
jgi:hypothetical protein